MPKLTGRRITPRRAEAFAVTVAGCLLGASVAPGFLAAPEPAGRPAASVELLSEAHQLIRAGTLRTAPGAADEVVQSAARAAENIGVGDLSAAASSLPARAPSAPTPSLARTEPATMTASPHPSADRSVSVPLAAAQLDAARQLHIAPSSPAHDGAGAAHPAPPTTVPTSPQGLASGPVTSATGQSGVGAPDAGLRPTDPPALLLDATSRGGADSSAPDPDAADPDAADPDAADPGASDRR